MSHACIDIQWTENQIRTIKVEAIKKMPRPTDKAGVRRIIGMVTYLSKFLENLSALCEPLRQLTRQDVQWTWPAEHDNAMQKIENV